MDNLTREQIHYIAENTRGRGENPLWNKMNRCRLTACNFAVVLNASLTKRRMDYRLRTKLFEGIDNTYLPPVDWGIKHEKQALESYISRTQHEVKTTGLWLFPESYFAASPDGLVYENEELVGIVQVKCPWRLHDRKIQQDENWANWVDYITPSLLLSKSHDYYHQVQGELAATGAAWCDFFVWSPQQVLTIRVLPDQNWQETQLPCIKRYYMEKILRPEDQSLVLTYSQMNDLLKSNVPISRFIPASILRPNTPDEHSFSNAISSTLLVHLLGWIGYYTGGERASPKVLPKLLTQARKHSCLTCIRSTFLKNYPEYAPYDNLLTLDLLKYSDLYATLKRNVETSIFMSLSPPCACSP